MVYCYIFISRKLCECALLNFRLTVTRKILTRTNWISPSYNFGKLCVCTTLNKYSMIQTEKCNFYNSILRLKKIKTQRLIPTLEKKHTSFTILTDTDTQTEPIAASNTCWNVCNSREIIVDCVWVFKKILLFQLFSVGKIICVTRGRCFFWRVWQL